MSNSVILGKAERKCVFTFKTTADAMQMEKICRNRSAPGRLIPVPSSIQAGCGMCWAAPPDAREQLEALTTEAHLVPQSVLDTVI